jgi:cytidylate kinase
VEQHNTLPSTIAVDGPAGSGKSAVSFAVAQRLGYLFVDTGAFYRAITFLALERNIPFNDPAALAELARQVHLDMTPDLDNDGRQYTVLADGRDITPYLHTPDVDAHVSQTAAAADVRAALLDTQRRIAGRGRVIAAGRDIGTVVLPDADLKIYLDASLDERAERRYAQRIARGEPADLAAIRRGLAERDELDTHRDVAPLLRAPDAVYLDTTSLSLEESIEAALQIVLNWQPARRSG